MAKPIAFDDEQVDADLCLIVGPWDQVESRNYRDSIQVPSCVEILEADQDEVAFVVCDGNRSVGKSNLEQSTLSSSRKVLTRPFFFRRTATIAATVVVAVGVGLFLHTIDMTEQQKPVAAQSMSNDAKAAVQAQGRTWTTYPSDIAIRERATEPPFASPKTTSLEVPNRATQRLAIDKQLKRKAVRVGGLAIAKHDTLKSKASADKPSPTSRPRSFAVSDTTETSPSSSPFEAARSVTLSTRFVDEDNSARARRDSVQALRSLRRQ